MKSFLVFGLLALAFHMSAAPLAAGAEKPCDPSNPAFICGFRHPEDLVRLPGTPWVIASTLNFGNGDPPQHFGPGPLRAIHIETREVRQLYPAPDSTVDWDRQTYPDSLRPPELFSSHGVNVRPLGGGKLRVYVVNHGGRESIEVLDVDTTGGRLKTSWRGSIFVPASLDIWPNGVSPLPNDGVVLAGYNVATWRPGQGWKKLNGYTGRIPGGSQAEGSGAGLANGVEATGDGQWIFVADTTNRSVIRLSVDGKTSPVVLTWDKDFAPGTLVPDNLRWGEDGYLYATGPYFLKPIGADCFKQLICSDWGTGIVRIDPKTLAVKKVFAQEGIKGEFGSATTVVQVGDRFWVGTSRGDRIMIVKP